MIAPDLFSGVLPFFHVAEAHSFRRAAERLGVTPAAVSKAVLRLEEGLGVKLLARTSRTVGVTPEGERFLARCREAIASVQAGREQVTASRRMPRGLLHATLPFILGKTVIPELARLGPRYPDLTFRISMTDRLVHLIDEGVDVAVRIGELEDSSLVGRPLGHSRWVTLASPAYLARHGVPAQPSDLARHNCLRFVSPRGRPRDWTFAAPQTGGSYVQKVDGNLLIDQGEHLLTAALAGLGLCQVLDFMVGTLVRDGQAIEVLSSHAAAGPPIQAIMTRERASAPNVKAFVAFLVEIFAR